MQIFTVEVGQGWLRLEAKEALDRILMPKSIAVIGASKDPFKWGHMLLTAIIKGGYERNLYPINPKEKEIEGLPCYPSVKDVPGAVDMAIVVVPAGVVPSIFTDLVEKGVKGAVVITSGFGEAGEEGRKLVEEMKENAGGKVRFVGPNCMGICSSAAKLSALMIPFLHEKGEVAFVSQSGGYGLQLYLRASAMGVGINKFISSGNEADITSVDYLRYFAEDPSVNLISMYIEGLKRGREWYEAAKEITKKKPIVVIKVGTTEEGGKAAASHTGALSGSDKVYDAAFKQAGVIRANDAAEMFDFIKGLLYSPLPRSNRIGIVSNSGGIAVETADALISNGLKVPTLSEEAQEEILKVIPDFGNPRNPVDLTASLNMNSFLKVPDIVLSQENIDGLITIGLGTSILHTMFPDVPPEDFMGIYKWINEQLTATYKKYEKPVIVINPAADIEPEAAEMMEEAQIPVYTTPERAADVMGVLYRRKLYLDKAMGE
jgi:acetyl coenzyme A synthetase (ADP forming)-like protein